MKTLLLLAGLALPAFAITDNNANLWVVYNGDHAINKSRWGVHLEGQWRRSDVGLNWQQYLIRPGVNIQVNKSLSLTLGYVVTKTYRYGDHPVISPFPEQRAFEQMIYTHRIGKLNFANRVRFEQRFFGQPALQPNGTYDITSYRYENRFRYQLRTEIPLAFDNRKNFIGLSDEIMFNFGKNVDRNVFDQNRAFISLGRNLGHETKAELGFMEQTFQRRGGAIYEHNHTLMLVITSRLPFGD